MVTIRLNVSTFHSCVQVLSVYVRKGKIICTQTQSHRRQLYSKECRMYSKIVICQFVMDDKMLAYYLKSQDLFLEAFLISPFEAPTE